MKIIIPMAGAGKRLRPHTLTIPKPLIPVAGKPIVHRLVEDIVKVCGGNVTEIAFVVGRFGTEVENQLIEVANSMGAEGKIYYQDEPLGTAHAVHCALPSVSGNTVVAFADTLFRADFSIETSVNTIWVKKVDDPSQFGVVTINDDGFIDEFVEKPKTFVSDLAIIGIYYFADGDLLAKYLTDLIDKKQTIKGEYQLTDVLENMKRDGHLFAPKTVTDWLDCGNQQATLDSNQAYLGFIKGQPQLISHLATINNSTIIEPVFIGDGAQITDSIIGPFVSVGKNTKITRSVLSNSIIQSESEIKNLIADNSMLGNHLKYYGKPKVLGLGDYNHVTE